MAGEPDTQLSEYYVSPTGHGAGTQADPTSLAAALTTGKNIYMMDGVYIANGVTLAEGVTMRAVVGARPVIYHSDGKPPGVHLNAGAEINGIWFGGAKANAERPITFNNLATIQNCTFFGYYGGLVEGSNTKHLVKNNRFINCGTESLYHAIYISNQAEIGSGAVIDGNIFISTDGGYSVQLWHEPTNTTIISNFFGNCYRALVIDGIGHEISKNIIWSDIARAVLFAGMQFNFSENVIGAGAASWSNYEQTATIDHNYFAGFDPSPYTDIGTNPVQWQEADIVSNLGKSSAQIDAAVSALESAFAGTVQQIHDDATIETHFATLKAVIDEWKLH